MGGSGCLASDRAFRWKKWSVIGFCSIVLMLTVILVAIPNNWDQHFNRFFGIHFNTFKYLVNLVKEEMNSEEKPKRDFSLDIFVVFAMIPLLIYWFGLLGALLEHFCLTTILAVFMAINTMFTLWLSVNIPLLWISFAICFGVMIITFSFAYDLRKRHQLVGEDVPEVDLSYNDIMMSNIV